jgi:hypothetical protein
MVILGRGDPPVRSGGNGLLAGPPESEWVRLERYLIQFRSRSSSRSAARASQSIASTFRILV